MSKFHQRILKIFSANAVSIEPSFLRQFCWDSDQFLRLPQFSSPEFFCKLIARRRYCVKISDCRKLKIHSPKPTGSVIPQFTNRPGLPQDRPGTNIHPTGLFCSASYVTCTPAYPLSILSCRHWNPTDMKRFFYNAFIHLRIFHFYC